VNIKNGDLIRRKEEFHDRVWTALCKNAGKNPSFTFLAEVHEGVQVKILRLFWTIERFEIVPTLNKKLEDYL